MQEKWFLSSPSSVPTGGPANMRDRMQVLCWVEITPYALLLKVGKI